MGPWPKPLTASSQQVVTMWYQPGPPQGSPATLCQQPLSLKSLHPDRPQVPPDRPSASLRVLLWVMVQPQALLPLHACECPSLPLWLRSPHPLQGAFRNQTTLSST